MAKFDIFLKPNGLSKIGQLRAYDEEFSTETYDKVFSAGKGNNAARITLKKRKKGTNIK